jgi:pimeloyl-ACP methyl ester carboxylesterase
MTATGMDAPRGPAKPFPGGISDRGRQRLGFEPGDCDGVRQGLVPGLRWSDRRRRFFDAAGLPRNGVPQRIKAPTLLMTADRGQAQSVEKARQYQTLIPNSQLVVVRSDAYHIAAANADECVASVLAFIKETKHRA